jgi:hypothetical protein
MTEIIFEGNVLKHLLKFFNIEKIDMLYRKSYSCGDTSVELFLIQFFTSWTIGEWCKSFFVVFEYSVESNRTTIDIIHPQNHKNASKGNMWLMNPGKEEIAFGQRFSDYLNCVLKDAM